MRFSRLAIFGFAAALAASVAAPASAQDNKGDSLLKTPVRRDTVQAKADSLKAAVAAAAAQDPLTRFLGTFAPRNLGPAAYSGRVTSLAVPRPYRKTIYVGTAGGGVWKTSNGGITWRAISDSAMATTTGDLAVAPSDTNIVWVGTGEKNSLRSQSWGNGVFKSTNGGRTWTSMGLSETREIGRVIIHPTDPNIVYVAALGHLWGTGPDRGIFKTIDGGKTWSKVLFVNDTSGFVDLEMDPSNPEVLYAASWHRLRWGGSHMQGVGAGSAIWKSADGGKTWTKLSDAKLNNGLPHEQIGRVGISVSEKNPNILYAMIAVDKGIQGTINGQYGGIFRSNDAGVTWTHVNDVAANPHYYYDDAWIDPTNPERVFLTTTFLFGSKDGGRTFEPETLTNVHVDHHALWIDPADPEHMILGNDGGVYITNDRGKAWEHMQIPIGQAYVVAVDSAQSPYTICAGLQDNGVWCGPSQTRDGTGVTDADWYSVNGGDGMWVQVPFNDPTTVYSESQFGNMSRLNLRTWERTPIAPAILDAGAESGYDLTYGWTTPIVQSQYDSTVVYVGANRLIRLLRKGDDWEFAGPDMTRADRLHPEPENTNTSYHAIYSIAESPKSRDVIWTGSDDGLIWLTRDYGKTWSNLTGNFPKTAPTRCFAATIAASYHAEGTAYLAYDCHHRDDYRPHFFRTTDYGKTWTEIVAGLPADGGSLTIFESPKNARILFAGTSRGMYVSLDAGSNWRKFGRGLPPVPIEKFAMSFAQRELVIGTHGRGIWTLNVAALEDMSDSLLTEKFHLFAVGEALQYRQANTYPAFGTQPFVVRNPPRGATIRYWLKDALNGPVDMLVTTAQGDTVRRLSGPGYSGMQSVQWDLNRDRPRPRTKGDPTDPQSLLRVEAGTYRLTTTVNGKKYVQMITVKEWPGDKVGRVR
ncbi:MAG: BNR/Asp-box repeat [Gemmatimonadetes bacterium]|nr:BNR/Asp-box repeat [Gemmatimonadota bacterium]